MPLDAETTATVLALLGVRTNAVVLDALPDLGLTRALSAAADVGGLVITVRPERSAAPEAVVNGAVTHAVVGGTAAALRPVRGLLAPGARVLLRADDRQGGQRTAAEGGLRLVSTTDSPDGAVLIVATG